VPRGKLVSICGQGSILFSDRILNAKSSCFFLFPQIKQGFLRGIVVSFLENHFLDHKKTSE